MGFCLPKLVLLLQNSGNFKNMFSLGTLVSLLFILKCSTFKFFNCTTKRLKDVQSVVFG